MQQQHNVTSRSAGPEFSADDDDFAALYEKNTLETGEIREGSIVTGTVVDIIGDYAVVDVGCKAEGQVPLREFAEEDGTVNVHVGDKIEVLLEATEDAERPRHPVEGQGPQAQGVGRDPERLRGGRSGSNGIIQARVKGGLAVLLQGGVKAFLPGSQVDLRPVRNLDMFINKGVRASRSSSSTRSAATSCCRAASCSRRSART
jgi:small subunit ribosomal protein S1